MSRADELRNDYKNILNKWEKALESPETELSRDAAILRFELAFEVAWKLIQHLAKEEGYEVKSPRQAFQQAFTLGWITDEVIWHDILKARNKATHVYREVYAKALYQELCSYLKAFKELEKNTGN
ncbi:MAG TPA: HI0074 family nucleotidyltransferase substrate-binding subunit [Balneolaceae bacterium]|nr:HI0074 family nucleotidyltransferase substrate-binding subunit [Balneolaceae bacterium]